MTMKRVAFSLYFLFSVSLAEAAFIANRDFLSVAQGARATAMGEAFAAVADDSTAIFWNPAGLTQLEEDEISVSYADRFDELADETQIHYARRGRKGMWGFAYVGSFVNDIEITQSLSQDDLNAIQTGAFAPTANPKKNVLDNALLFSYARPLAPESDHALGATVKFIYRDLVGIRGFGSAIDLGYFYTGSVYRVGVNVQNAASLVSFSGTIDNLGVRATATESYLPNIKSGIAFVPSWRFLGGKMLLSFDVNTLTTFDVENYNTGVEYRFAKNVALRGGKVFSRQDDSGEDFSLGLGIGIKSLLLDFSFLSSELGDTLRGTVSYRLGGNYYTPKKYK